MKPLEYNDKNVKEQIRKNLKGLMVQMKDFDILIGIPSKKKSKGQSIADYAYLNEYGRVGGSGVPTIPARPFLRTTFVKYREEAGRIMQKVLKDMCIKNAPARIALTTMAIFLSSLVQKNIKNGDWEANSPYTIKRKGSSKPLIDTGAMLRAVSGWIKKRSGR